MDREKLIYDLSMMYVQEVVRNSDHEAVKELANNGTRLFYGSFKMASEFFSSIIPEDFDGGTGEM